MARFKSDLTRKNRRTTWGKTERSSGKAGTKTCSASTERVSAGNAFASKEATLAIGRLSRVFPSRTYQLGNKSARARKTRPGRGAGQTVAPLFNSIGEFAGTPAAGDSQVTATKSNVFFSDNKKKTPPPSERFSLFKNRRNQQRCQIVDCSTCALRRIV